MFKTSFQKNVYKTTYVSNIQNTVLKTATIFSYETQIASTQTIISSVIETVTPSDYIHTVTQQDMETTSVIVSKKAYTTVTVTKSKVAQYTIIWAFKHTNKAD